MDRSTMPSLEEQLKAAIRATGKTVTEVARAAGVTQPALCRFMNGTRSIKLETVERLCLHLGLGLAPVPLELATEQSRAA
jgi:transcriptional regulator with XRE-family HTH domain